MAFRFGTSTLFLFFIYFTQAQYQISDLKSAEDPTEWYDQQVGLQNTLLQNGELVELRRKSKNTHAYFRESNWLDTDVTYYGQRFQNVPALYDIENDKLIIKNTLGPSYSASPIRLTSAYVSEFTIGTSRFVFIEDKVEWRQPGFYKSIHEGPSLDLISKVYKSLEIRDGLPTYRQSDQYFLRKDGKYYRLKNLRDLLKLYPDHKKQIRKEKRDLSIRNIDNPKYESELQRLIAYCNNIRH